MRSPSRSHATVGGASALSGAVLAVVGVARPGFGGASLAQTPLWVLLLAAGFSLSVVGVLTLLFAFRPAPAEPDVVPAHVAFNSRMSVARAEPPLRARPTPAGAAAGASARAASASPSKAQPPAPGAQQRVGPSLHDPAGLDAQIRELSKRISKAGVMLATGQLSQEGYAAYVEDLKRQRGNLEAARVRAEYRS